MVLGPVLQSTLPREGSLVQLTVDQPFTDSLGGHQRIQISVLYYRWRTESFQKISSGFLGILAMISAVGEERKTSYTEKTTQMISPKRAQPLQIDATMTKEIYKIIEPRLRLGGGLRSDQRLVFSEDKKARRSLQMKSRGDDGVWRVVGKV